MLVSKFIFFLQFHFLKSPKPFHWSLIEKCSSSSERAGMDGLSSSEVPPVSDRPPPCSSPGVTGGRPSQAACSESTLGSESLRRMAEGPVRGPMAEPSSQTCEDGCWGGLLCPARTGVGWGGLSSQSDALERRRGQGREAGEGLAFTQEWLLSLRSHPLLWPSGTGSPLICHSYCCGALDHPAPGFLSFPACNVGGWLGLRAWVCPRGLPFLAGENCPLAKGNLDIRLAVRVREPDRS